MGEEQRKGTSRENSEAGEMMELMVVWSRQWSWRWRAQVGSGYRILEAEIFTLSCAVTHAGLGADGRWECFWWSGSCHRYTSSHGPRDLRPSLPSISGLAGYGVRDHPTPVGGVRLLATPLLLREDLWGASAGHGPQGPGD